MREYLIPAPFVQIDAGVSEESRRLSTWLASVRRESSRSVVLGWRDELKAEIADVYRSRTSPDWDGHGANPMSPATLQAALHFASMLPDSLIEPDIVPEPSGTISLEWRVDRNNIFSVEMANDALVYAGILDSKVRKHGQEPFTSSIPEVIASILASHFRKEELD